MTNNRSTISAVNSINYLYFCSLSSTISTLQQTVLPPHYQLVMYQRSEWHPIATTLSLFLLFFKFVITNNNSSFCKTLPLGGILINKLWE